MYVVKNKKNCAAMYIVGNKLWMQEDLKSGLLEDSISRKISAGSRLDLIVPIFEETFLEIPTIFMQCE